MRNISLLYWNISWEGPLGNHYDYGTAIRPSYKKVLLIKFTDGMKSIGTTNITNGYQKYSGKNEKGS